MRHYCAGMVRSGSTWLYNVTAELLEGCGRASRVGFAGNEAQLERWIAQEPDAVIKIHRPFDAAVADIRAGHASAVYIHRDLRDVAASLMQYESRPLDEILGSGRLEQIWRDHQAWTSVPGILVRRYESMMADRLGTIEAICAYLELNADPARVRAVEARNALERRRNELLSRRSPLDALLHRPRAVLGRFLRAVIGRDATARLARPFGYLGGRGVDPHTHLHRDHIAHGGVDSYRDVMTRREQQEIEGVVARICRFDPARGESGGGGSPAEP